MVKNREQSAEATLILEIDALTLETFKVRLGQALDNLIYLWMSLFIVEQLD